MAAQLSDDHPPSSRCSRSGLGHGVAGKVTPRTLVAEHIGVLNTFVCFGVPTVAATSSWRPILNWLSTANYAGSLLLTVTGGILWFRSRAADRAANRWIAPMILCAIPFLLWSAVGMLFAATG